MKAGKPQDSLCCLSHSFKKGRGSLNTIWCIISWRRKETAFVETNYFWNKFQYLTSHTGTEGQLLQDAQLHRGLGNCDFIKHWSQPTFMSCQEGCPALWCCPWPQHASHNFPFTSLLCPWPTLCQSRKLNQHRALQVLCHRRFFAGQFPAPAGSKINT